MRFVVYPSDVSKREWQVVRTLLPHNKLGRPRIRNLRGVLNAILYLHHTGCQWRYLPKNYPKWELVYYYFSRWSRLKSWESIAHELHRNLRVKNLRSPLPRLGIVDAQSIKCTQGEERTYDGFKKVMGRKRNILVDALGIIIGCHVHAANIQERIGAKKILDSLSDPIHENLETIMGDKGYCGAFKDYAEYYHGMKMILPNYEPGNRSNLKPLRWIVERTFAWLGHYRRMNRDYEKKVIHSEAMLYISMLPILLHRLAA